MNKYKCAHCDKVIKRQSDKKWIKSYCSESGKNVRLTLIKLTSGEFHNINI